MHPVQGFALDRTNQILYTTDADGLMGSWDLTTGACRWWEGAGHGGRGIVAAALSSDGRFVNTIGLDNMVRFNECKTATFSPDGGNLGSQPAAVAAAHKDPELAAVVCSEKLVIVRHGKVVSHVDFTWKALSVAFSLDDSTIAVGGQDKNVHVFALTKDTAKETAVLSGHPGKVLCVAFSPEYIVSADSERHIYFWKDGKNLNETGWTFHNAPLTSLAFPPSYSCLATSALDQDLIIWTDLKKLNAHLSKTTQAHIGGCNNVAFLNETTLISSGADRTIKIWKIKGEGLASTSTSASAPSSSPSSASSAAAPV
jgi:WD40 repeat protein